MKDIISDTAEKVINILWPSSKVTEFVPIMLFFCENKTSGLLIKKYNHTSFN